MRYKFLIVWLTMLHSIIQCIHHTIVWYIGYVFKRLKDLVTHNQIKAHWTKNIVNNVNDLHWQP